jgi:hypothetical protein
VLVAGEGVQLFRGAHQRGAVGRDAQPGEPGGQCRVRGLGVAPHLRRRLDHRTHRVGGVQRGDLGGPALQRFADPVDAVEVLDQDSGITRADVADPMTEGEPFGQELADPVVEVARIAVPPAHVVAGSEPPPVLREP